MNARNPNGPVAIKSPGRRAECAALSGVLMPSRHTKRLDRRREFRKWSDDRIEREKRRLCDRPGGGKLRRGLGLPFVVDEWCPLSRGYTRQQIAAYFDRVRP